LGNKEGIFSGAGVHVSSMFNEVPFNLMNQKYGISLHPTINFTWTKNQIMGKGGPGRALFIWMNEVLRSEGHSRTIGSKLEVTRFPQDRRRAVPG